MMASATPIQLTSFLWSSTPHLLAYALPLLLLATLLAFSGTFLTLDRSRTFAPRSDVAPSIPGAFEVAKKKASAFRGCLSFRWLRFDGGVGGAAAGYVFGLHLATFLVLLISNASPSRSLTPTTFVVVWVFTVTITTAVAARWKPVALLFIGLAGGISMSLGLSVLTHPTLAARVILSSIVAPLLTLIVLLPLIAPPLQDRIQYCATRVATACLGSFSITMSIAILTRSPLSSSWANPWDRLWVANGVGWENARERGFDVLFCVLWAGGALSDYALRRWIGEDPDEKWDSYLADYSTTMPNAHDRTGNFQPLQTWWSNLLAKLHMSSSSSSRGVAPLEILFPSDAELARKKAYGHVPGSLDREEKEKYCFSKDHMLQDVARLSKDDLRSTISPLKYDWHSDKEVHHEHVGYLRKGRPKKTHGRGFTRVHDSDVDESDDLEGNDLPTMIRRPTFLQKAKESRQRSQRQKATRKPVEFQPTDGFSSSDDETSNDELSTPKDAPTRRVQIHTTPVRMNSVATSMSGTTVVLPSATHSHNGEHDPVADIDVEKEKARIVGLKGSFGVVVSGKQHSARSGTPVGAPDYSDVEELDVTNALDNFSEGPTARPPTNIDSARAWKPAFMTRRSDSSSVTQVATHDIADRTLGPEGAPPGAVPMTPSLLKALNRITVAQSQAFGPKVVDSIGGNGISSHPNHIAIPMPSFHDSPVPGLPIVLHSDPIVQQDLSHPHESPHISLDPRTNSMASPAEWDSFWQEVLAKASSTDRKVAAQAFPTIAGTL